MATPMRCRAHGRLSGDACDHPGCFEPVEPDTATSEGPYETCAQAGCNMSVPCPLHSTGARRDAGEAAAYMTGHGSASASLPEAQTRADTPVDSAELRFPWGAVAVRGGELIVGRDYAAQCGAEIEDFTNVSRLHATITLRSGQIFLEDHASTNGTSVNGYRIPEFQPATLVDGDVVGFGAHLRAVVSTRAAAR